MKRIALVTLALLVVAQQNAHPQEEKKEAEDEPKEKVEFYAFHVKEDGFDVLFREIERGENFSVARVESKESTSVGSSMMLARAFWDIAVIRKFDYYAVGKNWRDEKNSDIGYVKVYFTNDRDIPLKELSGDDLDQDSREVYADLGYISVEEWGGLFEYDRKNMLRDIAPAPKEEK